MKIPGVSSVVAGLTGGAAQVVRAGVSTAAGAAGALQTLTSPVTELAGPVVQSVAETTGRAIGFGGSSNGSSGHPLPPVRWQSGRRVHLDLDPLLPFPRWDEYAAVVEEPVRRIPGVAKAHVEGSLGRLVVEFSDDADPDTVLDEVREAIVTVAADIAPSSSIAAPSAPFADPGNPLAVLVPLTAAALDIVAVSGAVTGWVTRLPAAPKTTRAAAALINHQPRMVAILESRLGRVGTDIALAATTAAAYGLTQAIGTPLIDLTQRTLQISEATAHRRVWRDREPALASPQRPQAPVVPVISSAGAQSQLPRHSWAAAAAGEASHVVVGGSIDAAIDTAKGSMAGPVESYVDSAANGALIAAASALVAGGGTEDAAGAIEAAVPRAAHMGRQAFAAVLGRGLANSGQLVLDPGALRRLDRVKVVVIDGAALRGDHRAVLRVHGDAPGWDDDRVYEVADALLHGEEAPEPDPDELPATGARLRWVKSEGGPSGKPAQGLENADLIVDGECVGSVAVGWEVDPYAIPLFQTANRTGARVVLRHVAGTEDLTASVGASHPPGTPLLNVVRELRVDRGPVLLITALHRDFASTDTLAALAIADVGVALDDPRAATAWTADIITGTDLADAVRILSAIPVARSASESAVHLAQGGTTLAGLLLVTGEQGTPTNPVSFRRWLNPVNAAAATALMAGTLSATRVLRMPDPTPQPLTAWHALDPEIVYSRLAGGARPLAVETESSWRRRLDDLSYSPAVAPLRGPLHNAAKLASATRAELADPLTPILAVGAAASAIVGSNIDALLVAGVMTVNAITGGAQRLRAEAAAAELFAEQDQMVRRVVVPGVATTKRRLEAARHASRTVTVSAKSLRPGDVIDLTAPEVVPADARVLVAEDLEVDESLLTGESLPVDKQEDPVAVNDPERSSMLFEGSTIVAGHARAIVVATGVGTAAHRAISAVANVETSAGVQARLRELTSKVLPLTLAGGATVSVLALLRRATLRQAVADGVAIAVAAVPEGLPLVATLSQLSAAQRLTARGALVRAPRTIEALGRVDTVCFDKTGTLTENKLRVVCALPDGVNPDDPFPELANPQSAKLLRTAARASTQPQEGQGHAHATDEAIITAAGSLNGHGDADWTLLAEVPFESSRGFAASIGTVSNGSTAPMLVLKGAPEVILPRCRFADADGDRNHAESVVHSLAEQGLRVLAVAQRGWEHETTEDGTDADAVDAAAQDLELLGYVGLADTARASSRPLIEALVDADRNVVLITGDHPVTARAIARQLGMAKDVRVVTGAELAGLDEDASARLVADVQVFARVSPEQKVQIVAALQRSGHVTAMVGDGANDAAAIRMADVGIGVSGRGSSAARGAADIVLTDEDLGVLMDALVEGRSMWAGVRDAVTILVGGNVGEVLFTIIGTALGSGRAPVGTRQLLLVNLLTDMFPALAVAVTSQYVEPDEAEYESAEEADEARREHRRIVLTGPTPSLDAPLMRQIVTRGAVTAAGATAAWAVGRWTPGTERRTSTMGLTALVTTQLAQTLLTRRHSPLVVATALGSAGVLVGIVQTPVISQFFGCTPLGPVAWTGVLGSTAGATAISALAPNWLNRQVAALESGDDS